MTILLIHALRAAETLAAFCRGRAAPLRTQDTDGSIIIRDFLRFEQLEDVAKFFDTMADAIKTEIAGGGLTPEHQEGMQRKAAVTAAQEIIDRHPLTRGLPVDDIPTAREALAREIAAALYTAGGGKNAG